MKSKHTPCGGHQNDASNPPLEEKVNQAESLLKVEAWGRANADGRTRKGGDVEGSCRVPCDGERLL